MTFKLTRRSILAGGAAAVLMPAIARAAGWPERPITLVHGFGPGGNSDGIARVAAEGLTKQLAGSVVVDPRPGAGGTTAADQIARASADGYSLIMLTGAHAVAAAIYKQLPYKTVDDFTFISLVAGGTPFTIATYPDHPVNNPAELIEQAKKSDRLFTYASSGIGTTLHLAMELLASKAGIKLQHVPYKQNSQSMVDLLGKRIDFVINGPASVFPQIQSKEIKAIAVTSPTRYADLPDVPAIAEVLPGYDVTSYYGVAAPKDLPADVVAKLHDGIKATVAEPASIDRIRGLGSTAMSATPEEFRARVAADVAKWTDLVKVAKIEQI
ncbi:Bug family tripartite tricarboxylate transporter substrate binding protein [Phyllobacterium sophorae]|uniref:Tripartite tricarboxylate transporter substrate binding protein n=1 Tax=Phyllobacterium sophorae TaxID=1520277 RepID=A0A2P7B6L8_9HYPH|nr:tripartite tricarboxylate transporter substrate-binding protein [Phyllobacterium sophorae]PSH62112.1 tripartite tricarboxylate transporter substrate binding protein [Phyllobacterium sophorae]